MTNPTIKDVYERLGRIENKVDNVAKRDDETSKDHSSRIRALEKWRWLTTGAAAMTGGLISKVIS